MARNGPGGERTRDAAFLAFADRYRELLRGTAYLLVAEPRRAEHLASTVLARRYRDPGSEEAGGLRTALAELVRPRPAWADPPWRQGDRVELTDHRPPDVAPVVLELQRLGPGPRTALVLCSYAGLSCAEGALVLGVEPSAVEADQERAVAELSALRPERSSPDRLRDDLRAAVELHLARQPGPPSALTDLGHGRQLVRRGRLRQAAAVVAAVLVVVLGAIGVVRSTSAPVSSPEPAVAPSSVPTPSRPPGAVVAMCDVNNPQCQATVMRQWRAEMSRVAASHLDPDGTYFTGYSFSYDPRYDTPSFWAGRGGALGLEMFRLSGGATEVYLQIATGYEHAVRCGRTTQQRCESQRFMNGNRFTLSTSTQLSKGLEVQHRPNGDQIITVVARNTSRGTTLELTRGDLLNLVQDPRLRLPEI